MSREALALTPDGRLLFATRLVRLFAYGALAVVLALYLAQLGLREEQIGLLLTLTLAGDAVLSLAITGLADRVGRRRMLLLGAGMMLGAGVVFAVTRDLGLLTLAAIVGVISPSGTEVGPFTAIEQAILPQTAPATQRTAVFAWYNLAGSFATACGALAGGTLAGTLPRLGLTELQSYQAILVGYAALGALLAGLFTRLTPQAEAPSLARSLSGSAGPAPLITDRVAGVGIRFFGLHRSRSVVLRLTGLFMLDAFAGGLVVQSLIAYWFHTRFGADPALLGAIFFGANLLAGLSALAAARIAARFGLINTMVWTHLPSNVLLLLVPFMPTLPLAVAVLLVRFSISQMDVPTRQSYTMAVVAPDERSAAAGLTNMARTVASALGPSITGALLGVGWITAPFVLAGGLKIAYDLLLYRRFRALKPPDEDPKSPEGPRRAAA